MPISVQWSDESQTCIVVSYQGHWSWAEFQEAVQATNNLMNSVDQKVVLIEDTSMGGILPPGNVVAHGKNAIANFPDNLILIVVVANSSLIRTFLSIIATMNPGGRGSIIKTSATLEQALDMARQACPDT
jgi:hypothetical protein